MKNLFVAGGLALAWTASLPADPKDTAAFERLAVSADALPPEMSPADPARYSTNRLAFALNNGLAMTRGGRIWASWIAGEDGSGAFTVANWSDDGGETWSDVKFVIDGHDGKTPERTNIIGTFWLDPDGKFRCYTDQSVRHFDGRAGVWELVCENPDDANPRWSKPRRICNGHVLNKPIVLSSGDWAMTCYLNGTWKDSGSWPGAFASLDGERGATCLVSRDHGRTWEQRATVAFPAMTSGLLDWQESQLVELKDGTLRLFARVVDGKTGCLMAADSKDCGRSFSPSRRLKTMDNTNARFQIQRLKSGRLIFVKHGTPTECAPYYTGRHRLTAYLSDDDGETWQGGLLLHAGDGSYPDLFQGPDGLIYVTHDHDRGGKLEPADIYLHRFTEEDVLAKRIVSKRGRLGILVSRAMASPCLVARKTAAAAATLEGKIAADHKILTSDTWGGGHRIIFDFNGRRAWVVEPPEGVKPAVGMPWLWTMQWMGAYIQRTGAPDLMQKGFHHVHLEAFELRANDKGVAAFAEFQKYLVEKLGFNPRANLIGMSWGGFFSIRYAAANPQKVARIYLDAPLLNFQGFAPTAAPSDAAKQIGPWAYDQPKDGNWTADPRMPVNMAKQIAAAGIPVYLLWGGQDQTVKPALNCERFKKDFEAAGGKLKFEKRWLYGHHPHGFEHWALSNIIDFFCGSGS